MFQGALKTLVSIVVSAAIASAQPLIPYKTFTLHVAKDTSRDFLLAIAPDQSLIVCAPQSDGRWTVKRLQGWTTDSPREETIDLQGFPAQRHRWAGADRPTIAISPDGRYLIIRIQNFALKPEPPQAYAGAILNVIDLQALKVVATPDPIEPLHAFGDWRFTAPRRAGCKGRYK